MSPITHVLMNRIHYFIHKMIYGVQESPFAYDFLEPISCNKTEF